MNSRSHHYQWATWGDLNAFFGLMLDNVTNLVLLWGILAGVGFPQDIYFKYIVPGTALGVMVGDVVYTWMAFRLARKTGNPHVTAMPLGLDTPSTIGVAVAVLIPCFLTARGAGLSEHDAGMVAWKVGMATMVFMGLVKVAASFFGELVQKVVPQAGLLGSLAGVGVTLLGFFPLQHMYGSPVVGLVSLGIFLYAIVANIRLPGRLPGAFAAVALATAFYYVGGATGLLPGFRWPELSLSLSPALPTLSWTDEITQSLAYLPFAVPFGLLTIVGGINVTESARCAGDDFRTRDILLTEAVATLVAGTFGGVVQSTPYIGHPAYKAMGGRAAYTLACGLFVGIGAMLGLVSWVVAAIPAAAVAPLLFFVGMEITGQAYSVCPKKHYPAIFLALLPVVGELVRIVLSSLLADPGLRGVTLGPDAQHTLDVAVILGHGFIITSMLWAATLSELIDRKMRSAVTYLLIMAGLTLFGFIHSVSPNGDIYLPWTLPEPGKVYVIAASYAVVAVMFALLWTTGRGSGSPEEVAS